MPLNSSLKLAENLLDKSKLEQKPTREGYGVGLVKAGTEPFKKDSAQDIQDNLFRNMTAEKKISLASQFYAFSRRLGRLGNNYGTGRTTKKNRKHSSGS